MLPASLHTCVPRPGLLAALGSEAFRRGVSLAGGGTVCQGSPSASPTPCRTPIIQGPAVLGPQRPHHEEWGGGGALKYPPAPCSKTPPVTWSPAPRPPCGSHLSPRSRDCPQQPGCAPTHTVSTIASEKLGLQTQACAGLR